MGMDTEIATWTVFSLLGWAVACWLARRLLHVYADLVTARRELAASIAAGDALGREADVLRGTVAADRAELAILERHNYALACQLHGKDVVDKAIRDSRERGTN
jgi:hypothetical protein